MSSLNFYRQFEDRHRGSRELIRKRLEIYLPFIAPLPRINQPANAIDLGCGRGEWLELIGQHGYQAIGVDLDEGMLASCRKLSLNVQAQDAISALKHLPSNSQMLVSGFQIAEHLTFKELQALIQEAFRVLKTGGLLILETPNPENLVVSTNNFYLDPSHIRPLPPLLLSFLVEFYGFDRHKILRLQEPIDFKDAPILSIHDVLGGVSPDYSIVAQKNSTQLSDDLLSQAFSRDYGISLEDVCQQFTVQLNARFSALQQQNSVLQHQIASQLVRLNTLEKILSPLLWANQYRQTLKYTLGQIHPIRLLKKMVGAICQKANHLLTRFPRVRGWLIQLLQMTGIYQSIYRRLKPILDRPSPASDHLSPQSDEASILQALATTPPKTQLLYQQISLALTQQKGQSCD